MRPPVSVIVPFAGTDEALDACLAALAALELAPDDELLVADNRPQPRPGLVDTSGPASSYYARHAGARGARGEWLLFLDAGCVPGPGLLDAYFAPPPGERTGVLAGAVGGATGADPLMHPRPYGRAANLAVRRGAFEAVGGWPDPVRSGADADLCWRLAAAGWQLEPRPAARVRCRPPATLRERLGRLHRQGSGMQWLDRRYPGSFPPPAPRELAARFKLLAGGEWLEFLSAWAIDFGRLKANGDPTPAVRSRE